MAPRRRIKFNTLALQKRFSKIYLNFFSKCPIVVSTSGTFFWSGEHAATYGAPALLQKLPVRAYVGIEPVAQRSQIHIGDFKTYIPSEQQFKDEEPLQSVVHKLNKYLTRFLQNEFKTNDFPGFTLHYLSEFPAETGLNSSGALSSAIAATVLLFIKHYMPTDIDSWLTLPSKELLSNHLFNNIFRLGWKIESMVHGGVSSGACVYAPMLSSSYPILYFSERRSGSIKKNNKDSRIYRDIGENYDLLDRLKVWGGRLDEFFELVEPGWPIDFGLIYSGNTRTTESAVRATEEVKDILYNAQVIMKNHLKDWVLPKEKIVPYFSSVIDKVKNRGLWDKYVDAATAVSIEVMGGFKELFEKGTSETALSNLMGALRSYQKALYLLNVSSSRVERICAFLQDYKQDPEYEIGYKTTGAGKGGDIVFTCVNGGLEKSIFELEESLREKIDKNITLDYASWLDGIGGEGLKIEQDLSNSIYSPYISKGSATVKEVSPNGFIHTAVYTPEQFVIKKRKYELLFNEIIGDIFIKGQALTSEDLYSASATIDIFKILLKESTYTISSSQLPRSSYSTNRNEFQTKILTPLKRALRNKLNKSLDLEISGGLEDFSISLQPGVLIGFVEKIF